MRRAQLVSMLIGLAAAVPARGQFYGPEQELGVTGPLVWNFGGAAVVPLGPQADRLNLGGGFTAGLTFNPHPVLGLQLEYGGSWASLKSGSGPLAAQGIGGTGSFQYLDLNLVVHPGRAGPASFYLVGGGGLYYRYATITRVTGTAVVPYCDPWLYYCSATPVSTGTVLGSRSSWDWGLDAGLGVTFAVAPPLRLYLEARYHYVFGPSFTTSTGQRRTADGEFLPLVIGIRI
jgi:hypothetical protein